MSVLGTFGSPRSTSPDLIATLSSPVSIVSCSISTWLVDTGSIPSVFGAPRPGFRIVTFRTVSPSHQNAVMLYCGEFWMVTPSIRICFEFVRSISSGRGFSGVPFCRFSCASHHTLPLPSIVPAPVIAISSDVVRVQQRNPPPLRILADRIVLHIRRSQQRRALIQHQVHMASQRQRRPKRRSRQSGAPPRPSPLAHWSIAL